MSRLSGVDLERTEGTIARVLKAQAKTWGGPLLNHLIYARRPALLNTGANISSSSSRLSIFSISSFITQLLTNCVLAVSVFEFVSSSDPEIPLSGVP